MILGVGVDIVDMARFAAVLARTPALRGRLFTATEVAAADVRQPERTLAGRFAAKEALAKALGAPGLAWHDAEVLNVPDGRPHLRWEGTVAARAAALGVEAAHVSISHDGGLATAVVVLEGDRRA